MVTRESIPPSHAAVCGSIDPRCQPSNQIFPFNNDSQENGSAGIDERFRSAVRWVSLVVVTGRQGYNVYFVEALMDSTMWIGSKTAAVD